MGLIIILLFDSNLSCPLNNHKHLCLMPSCMFAAKSDVFLISFVQYVKLYNQTLCNTIGFAVRAE